MLMMRILTVHNKYLQRGGEDTVVEAETCLLRAYGHEVKTYQRDNAELESINGLQLFAQMLWSRHTQVEIRNLLREYAPDVIHVHNTFPLISPSLYWAADEANTPVVQTLHNFRLLCAQAMLMRDGIVCEDCVGHLPWYGIVRRCYRNSIVYSSALTSMVAVHRAIGTYASKVTRYIALSKFCRDKFIQGGLPPDRIVIKPNFAYAPPPPLAGEQRKGALFVGRLSSEKGLDVLVKALDRCPDISLDVIGVGSAEHLIRNHGRIRILGWLPRLEVYARMQKAAYLVMPSTWYETFGMVAVEAYACGLPVIASRLGSMAEMIKDRHTGLLFQPASAEDLAEKLSWAENNRDQMRQMGANARTEYESKYTAEKNYIQLMKIYEEAIATRKRA